MGKPSDKRHSAQRTGRLERARVKKQLKHRGNVWVSVGGVGTYEVKAGRKKYYKVVAHCEQVIEAHQACDSVTSKSGSEVKRPLYTMTLRPLHSSNDKDVPGKMPETAGKDARAPQREKSKL